MKSFRLAAVVCVAGVLGAGAAISAPGAAAVNLPSGFRDTVAIANLQEPTAVRFAPGGQVFVAEKSGKILVFGGVTDSEPTLFADLRTEVYNAEDRGLLGLALDPKFAEGRPFVYVLYAYDAPPGEGAPFWGNPGDDGDACPEPPGANTDGCVIQGRLSRLTANLATGKSVGEQPLITDWCQQFSSHSIGDLQFDPEGNLWVSGGEGASFTSVDYGQYGTPLKNPCDDPPAGIGGSEEPPSAEGGALRAQNFKKLGGSIIRVDPDTGMGVPGNPRSASFDANERRIVAKGFRNPFRFAFDPKTHEVYVDNVGSSIYEEIDRFAPTASTVFNSGWPCYEGNQKRELYEFLGLASCERLYAEPGSSAQPFFLYSHLLGVTPADPCPYEPGSAIAGLAFYEGGGYPASYDGALFFADAVRGCIYVMRPGEDGRPDPSRVEPFLTDGGLYPGVDIETGPEGDLFYVSLYGDGYGPGAIHRISYDASAPQARLEATTPVFGGAPLSVHFSAAGSNDPQGEVLDYEWDADGDGNFSPPVSASALTQLYSDGSKNRTASVRVTDEQGHSSLAQVLVYPGDTPPQPQVGAPNEAIRWRVGQDIDFAGSAADAEDGTLVPSRLYWATRLLHCPSACHAHPLQVFPAVGSGTLVAPDHDLPSSIEMTLTATDSRGLTASQTLRLMPSVVRLEIESEPPGIPLVAGDETGTGPFVFETIEDSHVTISAPLTAIVDGRTYTWSRWSDGGARSHAVVASGSAGYRAFYTTPAAPAAPGPPFELGPRPRAWILRHPRKRTRVGVATFSFAGENAAAFSCRIDRRQARGCRSPIVIRHLKPGPHSFSVVPLGADGEDGSPARFAWTVLGVRAAAGHRH